MLKQYFPILVWGKNYGRASLTNDLIAAIVVTLMLIPQSLAYAMLAGLPPQVGLYASMLPLIAYTIFGTSRTLAVGPVASGSLMTAVAVGNIAAQGSFDYYLAAISLAFISGLILVVMGFFRMGFLANFLSHPVISGFVIASGILIAAGQLKHILGVRGSGQNLIEISLGLIPQLGKISQPTLLVGVAVICYLVLMRMHLKSLLLRLGVNPRVAGIMLKSSPVLAVVITTLVSWRYSLDAIGVRIVGSIASGLPPFTMPSFDPDLWRSLAGSALLISVIGFVESVSVAQTLAAKRRQRIIPDQEMIALGTANIASALSGGFPVNGGFARSVVNFEAGAETPAAGAFTAIGITAAIIFLTPILFFLPQATLAATIIVAVLSLIDPGVIKRTWIYSKSDFAAMLATIMLTLLEGIVTGILSGVALSLLIHLYRTSRPHFAIVGQVPGTEHFRNILRHKVVTSLTVLNLRVDESLYFPNARFLEDTVQNLVAQNPAIRHVVLMCAAVNSIDASGLESLEAINARLRDSDVKLHCSEIKGPVMDQLQRSHFLEELTGKVFLSQYEAFAALDPQAAKMAMEQRHSHQIAGN
ncbi:MAG: sulfate permease, SulP family [Alphaproteobacteria bacterium]|nr:sulfate permease, SulP family [Alphaproteobacteria bacterium]